MQELSAPPEEKLIRQPTFSGKYRKYLWLLPLLLIILVFIGVYIPTKNKYTSPQNPELLVPTTSMPTASPIPTKDITANWKTYNDDYYSFRYPPDWVRAARLQSCGPAFESTSDSKRGLDICITRGNDKAKELAQGLANGKKLISYTNLIIDNHPVIKVVLVTQNNPRSYLQYAFIDDVKYSFPTQSGTKTSTGVLGVYFYAQDSNQYQDTKKIYDQILSTFQFTN